MLASARVEARSVSSPKGPTGASMLVYARPSRSTRARCERMAAGSALASITSASTRPSGA